MSPIHRLIMVAIVFAFASAAQSQTIFKAKIIDAYTKEPVHGASVTCIDERCTATAISNSKGAFQIQLDNCKHLAVSCIGYITQRISTAGLSNEIFLLPSTSLMTAVIVSATRGETVKRSQAPIAITSINYKTIQDAKPTSIDQLLNKVSGVNMVSLGNEQHQMSIRQPITTKSLFLYLEDGVPVRTTGLFNHNALLEINMASVKNIEVIKGPSSSLYGSEAIGGVVNFITQAPTTNPVLKLSAIGNNIGYKRTELQSSFSKNKWGFVFSGLYADKRNSFMEYTDFHKATLSARLDYRFNNKTTLSNSATWLKYYSDMPGGVDSAMFATRKFTNPQTFTYRKVNSVRFRSALTHHWNKSSKTIASLIYRDNSIGQNPAYRVKDDYKKVGNIWIGQKDIAHGEINESSFNSYAFIAQHKQNFLWKNTSVIGGVSADGSPSEYIAAYIRIKKDTVLMKYVGYQQTDSVLTHYSTKLNNYAAFVNFEFSPAQKMRVVASLRYDLFEYDFDNHLKPSAFSGSPDTVNRFYQLSPKIGFTYNFTNKGGLYANYSQGFVPPQVSEMYTGVKVPDLSPSLFYNYEVGGWIEVIKNKLNIDASLYQLTGTNEIVSVRLNDGSTENRNAGKTSHKGFEFGVNAVPANDLTIRFSGAFSIHKFVDFIEKGNNYSGNEMNGAPNWIHNAEIWYKPSFIQGLRIGAEWQKIGSYYMDAKNTMKYSGYNVLHLRAGYKVGAFEVWLNVLNATDNYYSTLSTKSNTHSYQLAEPRNFNAGISYDFGSLKKTN
jgi:iron complex outermembrane recepter protein